MSTLEYVNNHLFGILVFVLQLYTIYLIKGKGKLLATAQDVLDRVKNETTVLASVQMLVQQLKDNANDPAKLQEIVNALDVNDAALAAIMNTTATPTT